MGAISAKFSTPPSGKTMDWTQKSIRPKMMARTTSITMQNLVEIAQRTSAWEDEMWCFSLFLFFFVTLHGRRLLWCVVDLLPEDIASTFVGRFRCSLHLFCGIWTVLKIFARGRYDWCPNGRKTLKIWENGCKVCTHHFDHLEASWKKTFTTAVYPMYSRCAPV